MQGEIKGDVRAFYKKYPCGGDWTGDDSRHGLLPWFDAVFEFEDHEGELLLDVGCGTGIDLIRYVIHGAKVVGIDMSDKPIKIARQRTGSFPNTPSFVLCDLEKMPFKDGIFDMVYSVGVLHHTPNHEQGIGEILRVLKSGGHATILLYHKYSLATLITKVNRALYGLIGPGVLEGFLKFFMRKKMNPAELAAFREMWEHPLIKYFTRTEVKNLFEVAGFKDVHTRLFDAIYPLSRVFPKLGRIDVFQRVWGRFLITRAKR